MSKVRFETLADSHVFSEEDDVILKDCQFDELLNTMINHPDTASLAENGVVSPQCQMPCVRLDSWNIDESSKHLSFVIKKSQRPVDYSSLNAAGSDIQTVDNPSSTRVISRFGIATRPTGRILHYPLALASMRGSRKCCATFTLQAKAFNIGEYSSHRNKHNTGDLNACFSGSGRVMVDLHDPTGSGLYGKSKVNEEDSHGDYFFSFGVGLKPTATKYEDNPLSNENFASGIHAKNSTSELNQSVLRELYSKYGADSEAVSAISDRHKTLQAVATAERTAPVALHPNSEYNASMFGDICTSGLGSCINSWGLRCPIKNPVEGVKKKKKMKMPRACVWYHGGELVDDGIQSHSSSTIKEQKKFASVEQLPRNFVLEPGHLCDITVDLDKKEAFLCISKWVSGLDQSSKQTKSTGTLGSRKLIHLKRIELTSVSRRSELLRLGRELDSDLNAGVLSAEDIVVGCHVPIGYEVVMVLPGEEEKFGRQLEVKPTVPFPGKVKEKHVNESVTASKWMAAKKFASDYETKISENKDFLCNAMNGDYFDGESVKNNVKNRLDGKNESDILGIDAGDGLLVEAQEQERQVRFKLAHAVEETIEIGEMDVKSKHHNAESASAWKQHLNPLQVMGGRILSRLELVSATEDPIQSTMNQYDSMNGKISPAKALASPVEAISLLHKHHRHKHKHHKHHKHHHHLDGDSYGSEHSFEDHRPDTYGVDRVLALTSTLNDSISDTEELELGTETDREPSNNAIVKQLNDCHDIIVEEYKHVTEVYGTGKTASKENFALLSEPIHNVNQLAMLKTEEHLHHKHSRQTHHPVKEKEMPTAPVLWMHGCAGVVPPESMVTGILLPTQSPPSLGRTPAGGNDDIPDNILETYNNPVAIASRSSTPLYSCIIKRPAGNPEKLREIVMNMGLNARAMHEEILAMKCPMDGTKPSFQDLSMDTWLHDNTTDPKDRPAQMQGLDFREHMKQASLNIALNPLNQPPSLTADGDTVYDKYVVTSCMANTQSNSKYIEYKQLDPKAAQKVKEMDPKLITTTNPFDIPYQNIKILGSVFAPRIKVNSRMFLDDAFGHTYQACVKTLEPGTICEYLMEMLQPSIEYVWKKGVIVSNELNEGITSTLSECTVYPPLYAVTASKECPVRDLYQYIVRGSVPGKFDVISARYDIVVQQLEASKVPSPVPVRLPSCMEGEGGCESEKQQCGGLVAVRDSFDDDELLMETFKNAELEHNHNVHLHKPPRTMETLDSIFSSSSSNTSSENSSPTSNWSPTTCTRSISRSQSATHTPAMSTLKPVFAHGIPGYRIIQSRMWCFDYDMSLPVGAQAQTQGLGLEKDNYVCYIGSGEDHKTLRNVEFLCVSTVNENP